jgi:hypothetical protein
MLEVKPTSRGCVVVWRAQFLANRQSDRAVKSLVWTLLRTGLESLRSRFGVAAVTAILERVRAGPSGTDGEFAAIVLTPRKVIAEKAPSSRGLRRDDPALPGPAQPLHHLSARTHSTTLPRRS